MRLFKLMYIPAHTPTPIFLYTSSTLPPILSPDPHPENDQLLPPAILPQCQALAGQAPAIRASGSAAANGGGERDEAEVRHTSLVGP